MSDFLFGVTCGVLATLLAEGGATLILGYVLISRFGALKGKKPAGPGE